MHFQVLTFSVTLFSAVTGYWGQAYKMPVGTEFPSCKLPLNRKLQLLNPHHNHHDYYYYYYYHYYYY